MLDRVARPPGASCLLARGTRLGGVAFCHVNGSKRAIPANRGEINRENITVRSEYFRSYHLPVLSAEHNDSQSEEINVIDESQAENRPVPVQEAEVRCKQVLKIVRRRKQKRVFVVFYYAVWSRTYSLQAILWRSRRPTRTVAVIKPTPPVLVKFS